MFLEAALDEDVTFDPLEVIEHILACENLAFDCTEAGDLAFRLSGNEREYHLWFSWKPDVLSLQLCLALGIKFSKNRREKLYKLLSLVNQRGDFGHFELRLEKDEIIFRHAMALPHGDWPSLVQVAFMMESAVESVDRFYPAFEILLKGNESADAAEMALAACMLETKGEA